MKLAEILKQRQPALCERWVDAIFDDYGEQAALWRRARDPFANPIGHALRTEVPRLVEAVVGCEDLDGSAARALEEVLRIRAIQDLAPSRAVGFVYRLREVVRAELAAELADRGLKAELSQLDGRVEQLALLAFDVYVRCREQVHRARIEELKRSVALLMRRWSETEPIRADSPEATLDSIPGGDR